MKTSSDCKFNHLSQNCKECTILKMTNGSKWMSNFSRMVLSLKLTSFFPKCVLFTVIYKPSMLCMCVYIEVVDLYCCGHLYAFFNDLYCLTLRDSLLTQVVLFTGNEFSRCLDRVESFGKRHIEIAVSYCPLLRLNIYHKYIGRILFNYFMSS